MRKLCISDSIRLNNKNLLKISIDKIKTRASSSIIAEINGTILLITVVYSKSNEMNFFPLKIEYLEKFYANKKIPCNYYRREGRPSEREVMIARLIDRSIRPMFLEKINHEIQISITVLSINTKINPDLIAINGTAAALSLTQIPFEPIAAVKIIYDKKTFSNSSLRKKEIFDNNIIISGSKNKISMLEGHFEEINNNTLLNYIKRGSKEFKKIINFINKFKKKIYIQKNTNILKTKYLITAKKEKKKKIYKKKISTNVKKRKIFIINRIEKDLLREKIIKSNKRLDGRSFSHIRKILINLNFLKNIHGSAVFARGDTQAIVNLTLSGHRDAQLTDCVFYSHYKDSFILHYNFPSYAVNEMGNIRITKRREIGHANLAKKALLNILPVYEKFSYIIRIVSEITSSDGSSSMATVCGSSLALMNSGIPIRKHIAGIAMGLIKKNNINIILSDISGKEDSIGDMDFKITGTQNGLTALQMDTKINSIRIDIFKRILSQAKKNLKKILNTMKNSIKEPKRSLFKDMYKVKIFKIDKIKTKDIIGKNGVIIKKLINQHKCDIDLDNNGLIKISSFLLSNINFAVDEIKKITQNNIIANKVKIIKLTQFGALVSFFLKNKKLLNINIMNKHKQNNSQWIIKKNLNFDISTSKLIK